MKRILAMILSLVIMAGQCVIVNAAAEDTFSALEAKLPEIEELIAKCEARGMDLGYERIDYSTIKDFIEYGRDDISWGHTDRAEYVADEIETLYSNLYNKLTAYRSGAQKPMTVKRNTVKYFAGKDDGEFVNTKGESVYLAGYGLYGWSNRDFYKDIESFQDFGADVMQIEIVPNDMMYSKDTINGWSVAKNNGVDATAEIVYADENQGNALKVVNNTSLTANVYLTFSQSINVRENTNYVYSFKVKANNAKGVRFYPNAWKNISASKNVSNGTYDWKEYTCSISTGKGETDLTAMFLCENKTTELLIDDIRLVEVGDSENLVQNGDFEDEGRTSEHFRAWTAAVDNIITRMLDFAEKNDVMADVLIQPGTFSRLTSMYPEIAEPSSGFGYDMTTDIAKEALELYVSTIMERIKDHPALLSICISNEPFYDTRTDEENLPAYQEFLSKLYNNKIDDLNSAYGLGGFFGQGKLTSFSEVTFPDDTRNRKYYEWTKFNNQFSKEKNKYIADLVKKYAPDVPVHSKMMSILGRSTATTWGVDPEDFNEFTDFSGNDSMGFLGATTSKGLVAKIMWYDLLKSIAPDKPIINSEDHIIVDGSTDYSKENAIHVAADAWEGAIHGRNATAMWVWNRSSNESSTTYGNILYRPDAVALVGRRSLDLNRLSEQVRALNNKKNYVNILWSDTSFVYDKHSTIDVYLAALYAGANPKFITERQLIAGQIPDGVLAIPETVNVRSEAYDKIKAYANNGGQVWAIGSKCLTKNEKNESISGLTFTKQISISNAKTEFEALAERVVWGENNSSLENVEIISAKDGDATLVNLCCYDWDGEQTVEFDGVAIDLITNEKYKGSVKISPFEPILLRITDAWYKLDVVSESVDSVNLTANIENASSADTTGKISFKVYDKDGKILNSMVYNNRPLKDGKITTIKYSCAKNEDAYSVDVTAVIDGEELKESFILGE